MRPSHLFGRKNRGIPALMLAALLIFPVIAGAGEEDVAIKVDSKFLELRGYFKDARDHLKEEKFEAADQDLENAAQFLNDLREGRRGETVEGRASKMIRNSVNEIERSRRKLQNHTGHKFSVLIKTYSAAITALSEHTRKKGNNDEGELGRRDLAQIRAELMKIFTKDPSIQRGD